MNKVLSLQKEFVSKDVQLKRASNRSINCKTQSTMSFFFC
ncbi:class III lanthipeptide [Bacillus sp. JCM 19041]